MILKVLGSLLIIFGTTAIGFKCSNSLDKRVKNLKELELLILNLQSEVLYLYSTLPYGFENIAKKAKGVFNSFFSTISSKLKNNEVDSVYEAFTEAIEEYKDELNLEEEDYEVLLNLSKNLGELDKETHSNIFELSLVTLRENIKLAEEKSMKNKKLYKYLGFSLGAIVVITII